MAESLNSTRRIVFRDSKILVNVDHASDDLLVVSYPFKSKLFQGILIDSTNRYLPCAYPSPEIVKWSPPRVTDVKDPSTAGVDPPKDTDRAFYSLSNRFTYFQDVLFQKNVALVKSAKQANKARAQKMTVRLRPRQVLCSKCRSICNENSENVHSSGSGKKDSKGDKNNKNLLTETIINENQNVEIKSPRKKVRTTLVPKLSRLEPEDVRALNGNQVEGSRAWSEMLEADKQMVLRKKRSVGSMEDLWDETVFEEAAKKAKTTPIIKISFGSPGEGTVVKIPSKVQLSGSEGEDEEEEKDLTESSKSLKKAMKKAKKEAKRKISPEREEEVSPEEPNYKKHRHRVKHKKRHKNSKEEDMKDKCLKQKLSISLRRVCGPGEEESWSGESSRSSEAIKETDDTKPDSIHEIPSRVCENAQDCKVSDKEDSSPPEPLKKLKKSGFQRKKRSIISEDLILEEVPEKPGSKDGGEPLSSTKTTRSRQELIQSVKVAQTSLPKDELEAIPIDVVNKKSSISDKHSSADNINRSEESECVTKDIKEVRSDQTLVNQSMVQGSVKIKDNTIDYDAVSPPQLINMQCVTNRMDNKLETISRLDDNLEDTLISEDSMPELDETIEDALLESDKEMPESLENQRDISLRISSLSGVDDQWENEPEIPVLTRMVDPEDIEDRNTFKSAVNTLECSNSILNSESSIKGIIGSNDLHLPSDDVRLKQENELLKIVQKEQESISLKVESDLPNDEIIDSSGESEFLPAEDSFDCELPGVLTFPKESSSDVPPTLSKDSLKCGKSSGHQELPDKCVPSSDLKTFKDCLLPKDLLEAKKEGIKESSNYLTEAKTKRLKGRNSASSSVIIEPKLSLCDEIGCKDGETSQPSQDDRIKGRSSLHKPIFVSSPPQAETLDPSSCKNISAKCHLEILSSKMFDEVGASSNISLPQKESFLPNFGPFPCKVSKSNSCEESFEEMLVDPLVSPCSNASIKTSPRSPFKMDEICTERVPIESSLDTVPNFPDSSSQGAQEVTSCQAEDGTLLTVGDIVWAKIHGFPWWPAKVVRLCTSISGSTGCDARVAWFGSATSSLMSTDQLSPFIQTFKAKYNRERKSTGYLEAIRQARSEASSRNFHLPTPLTEIDELLAL